MTKQKIHPEIRLAGQVAARRINANQQRALKIARQGTERDGLEVTFEGAFYQNICGVNMKLPFVLAQTSEQRRELEQGKLQGTIYDGDSGRAHVEGIVCEGRIEFTKRYDQDYDRERKLKLAEKVNTMYLDLQLYDIKDGRAAIANPNDINYVGTLQDDSSFKGNYHFEQLAKHEMYTTSHGTFEMRRV